MELTQSYMGRMEAVDMVIQVRKFEPTQLGSNLLRLPQKKFAVFIEDVRLILGNLDLVSDGTPQRRVSVRAARQDSLTSNQVVGGYDPLLTYRLSSACKDSILKLFRRSRPIFSSEANQPGALGINLKESSKSRVPAELKFHNYKGSLCLLLVR